MLRTKKLKTINDQQQQDKEPVAVFHLRILTLLICLVFVAAALMAKVANYAQVETNNNMTIHFSFPRSDHSKSGANTPQAPLVIQPNHQQVITTEFWVGEPGDSDNGNIANSQSAWDSSWQQDFGGVDSPQNRNGYLPGGFTPHENSFYFALPYDDLDNNGYRKASANLCPESSANLHSPYSWCKNSWIAISYNGKIAYAQWEDVGPYNSDDSSYVFGATKPANRQGDAAGLDVSPAVTSYLGLNGLNKTDWTFVSAAQVQQGPWTDNITTDPGEQATTY